MGRARVIVLCAAVLASVGVITISTPANAECPYFPVPPATDAARSAREIIVGTVTENVGGQLFDFRLRIDHVLRGPAEVGDIRRVEFLYPKWPILTFDDGTSLAPCQAIPGSPGNVIALAYDAIARDGKTRYNAASWISGKPLDNYEVPGTTLAEMQELSGLPQTDAAERALTASMPTSGAESPFVLLVGLAAAVIVVLGLDRRLQRRPELLHDCRPDRGRR